MFMMDVSICSIYIYYLGEYLFYWCFIFLSFFGVWVEGICDFGFCVIGRDNIDMSEFSLFDCEVLVYL